MNRSYIVLCKSLKKDSMIYYEVSSKKIILSSIDDTKGSELLSFFVYTLLIPKIIPIILSSNNVVTILLLIVLGILMGILLTFLSKHKKDKEIQEEINDNEDILLFIERGRKLITGQLVLVGILTIFSSFCLWDVFQNNSFVSAFLALFSLPSLTGSCLYFDFARRYKLYKELSQRIIVG